MTDSNSNYSDLPQGWKIEKLGNFAQYKKGKKPKNLNNEYSEDYPYPYVDIQAFEVGRINNYTDGVKCVFCDVNDLLMVWDGSRSGYVGKGINGVLGSTLMKIKFPKIDNNFAFYFLQSKYLEINSRAKGTGTPHVDPNLLWNYILPIPPLSEQHRIVEKIEELFSELDSGVASLKKALEQLKIYRQAVLKWAFEGKLTEKWRNAHQDTLEDADDADTLLQQIKAERKRHYQQQLEDWKQALKDWETNGKETKKPTKPQQPKDLPPLTKEELSTLPSLPDGWCWVKVEQLGEVQLGRQRSPKNRSKDFPTKYIRAANITEKGLNLNDIMDMEFTPSEQERYRLKYGDIVLSEASGSSEQVGKPAMWKNQVKNCCFQNTVIRLRPICISSEYLLNLFLSYYRNGVFAQVASGVGINHLSANKFSLIPVAIAPIQEQTQIVQEIESRLSICDQLEATLTENLEKAEALRQSILKRAFEGKLVL